MPKIRVLFFLSICFFFFVKIFSAVPFVEAGSVVEEPTPETAALLIIVEVWKPDPLQYKKICNDPKLSLEEFNLISILGSKGGVSLSQIWRWRKLKIEWHGILKRLGLTLEDFIPRSEKKWDEPYQFCYTYWREKGDPKKVFSISDYNFEKLGEVVTLAKYSEKSVDLVIEEMLKSGSFRELSLKYYKEKTKKPRRR